MSDYETVTVERDGDVGTITVSRPEAVNAVNSQVLAELADVVDELAREVRVVVLTGEGDRPVVLRGPVYVRGRLRWPDTGTYDDEYVHEDGEWRFSSMVADFNYFTDYEEGWADVVSEGLAFDRPSDGDRGSSTDEPAPDSAGE